MENKFGFKSAEHAENAKARKLREKNKKQPVKFFSKEEAEALAGIMGLQVSNSFKTQVPKQKNSSTKEVEIVVADLPQNLRKYL